MAAKAAIHAYQLITRSLPANICNENSRDLSEMTASAVMTLIETLSQQHCHPRLYAEDPFGVKYRCTMDPRDDPEDDNNERGYSAAALFAAST